MENMIVKPQKKYIMMSLIYAYVISIGFFNALVGASFNTGGMIINISVILALACLNFRQMFSICVRPIVVIYISFIISIYLVTAAVSYPSIHRNEFYFYFALASFLGAYKCDYERVLRYTMYFSLLAIPFHGELFGKINEFGIDAAIEMGSSFAILPVCMAGVIHFFFFKRQGKVFDKICYIIDAFFLLEIILKGNRGIALATLVTVFSIYIKNWGADKKRKKLTLRLGIVICAALAIYLNFFQILNWLNEILRSLGIEAHFIRKIMLLQSGGDISNGRSFIFNYTLKEINKSPFWGHGISTILYNSGWSIIYPHNFLLQMLYDGGLLLTIPLIVILYKAIRYAFNGERREVAAFLLYMLLICIPKMSFSSDLWKNQAFWLLLVHVLQYYYGKMTTPVEEVNHDKSVYEFA